MMKSFFHNQRSIRRARSFAITASFTAALLFSGCVSTAVSRTDLYRSYYDEPIAAPASSITYEKQGETHIVTLAGDEYSMGFEYGKKAAELGIGAIYDEIFANATAMLRDDAGGEYERFITVDLVKELLVEAWDRMEPFTPAYALRLLDGFAAGSGLPLEEVKAMHAIPDFTETSCSALWATGSATTDASSLQIRVLDYIMGLGIQKYPAVVFMTFAEGHTVANIGWLGLLGVISGMNDAGLAVSEMGYGNPEGEHFRATPMPFLLLDVLRWADHPEEASGIIRSTPRTNSYVYVVGTADSGGLAFVTNAYSVEAYAPGEAHGPVVQLDDMLHAGHYQERMDALVAEHHGKISLEWLRDDFIPAIAMKSNLQAVIYDLSNRRFFVANAPDTTTRAADASWSQFTFPE
jgi:hypothetical protein